MLLLYRVHRGYFPFLIASGPASFARRALSRFLSLSASRSSACRRSTSANLFSISSLSFLRFSSIFSSCSIRCHLSAAHLAWRSTCSLVSVDCSVSSHCMKSQRGGGLYFQAELELTYSTPKVQTR